MEADDHEVAPVLNPDSFGVAAETLARAWCASLGVLMLWGYGLSSFDALASPLGWWFGAILVLAAAVGAGLGGWREFGRAPSVIVRECVAHPLLALIFVGVGVALLAGIVTAWGGAPSNHSALAYQLARVGYYLQHGNLGDYGANFMSQEQQARGTSIVQCAVLVLSGQSDHWVGLPQILGYLMCLIAVCAIARRLGARRPAALGVSGVFGCLTVAVMELPTAQNDLVIASLLGCGLVGTLGYLGQGRWQGLLLGAGGFALAVAVKASALTMGPACAVLILACVLADADERLPRLRRALVLSAATVFAVLIYAFPAGYAKDVARFGNPLGGDEMFSQHTRMRPNEPGRATMGLMNLVRFSGDFFTLDGIPESWAGAPGGRIKSAIGDGVKAAGLDVEAPLESNSTFSWTRPRWADENMSFFGWLGPAILLPGLIGALGLFRSRPLLAAASVAVGVFFLTQAFAGPYDPWRGRHFLYGAILAAPTAVWMFESRLIQVRAWAWLATIFGAAMVVPAVVWRMPNPLMSHGKTRDLFALNRLEQMAVHHPSYPALAAFERDVPPRATVIVALPGNEYEYALFGRGLTRTLITREEWRENPALEDSADFLLYDRRGGVPASTGDIDLGYHWSLRALGGSLRPGDFAGIEGLHTIEDRFAWMAGEMRLTVKADADAFVNLEVDKRFSALARSDHLDLIADGGSFRVPLRHDAGAVSIPISGGRSHELELVSPRGATSPKEHGLSADTRPLSYRVRVIQVSPHRRFPEPIADE